MLRVLLPELAERLGVDQELLAGKICAITGNALPPWYYLPLPVTPRVRAALGAVRIPDEALVVLGSNPWRYITRQHLLVLVLKPRTSSVDPARPNVRVISLILDAGPFIEPAPPPADEAEDE